MYFLDNTFCVDARVNLALEEVLFDCEFDEDLLMFWQNENAVIIGKNQFTYDEINFDTVKKDEVQVVRRNSGGGAVYHDLGNLNFSYITTNGNFDFYDPVITALKSLGAPAQKSGRNDLILEGKKFSGTAVYQKKGKILYHGTILFDSDLSKMPRYLNVSGTKLSKRHIASVSSRVTNIKDYLPGLSMSEFKAVLLNSFKDGRPVKKIFPEKFLSKAKPLVKEKYESEAWNFGRRPKGYKKIKFVSKAGEIFAFFKKEKDRILDIRFYGDFFSESEVGDFEVLCKNKTIEELYHYGKTAKKYFIGLSTKDYLKLIKKIEGN